MPKVVFVNEHRVVDVAAGKNLKVLLSETGVDPRATRFRLLKCGVFGACVGCQVWVRPADDGALPARTFREKLAGTSGQRRLSCQLAVQGDLEVTTMAGSADRLRRDRPIAPAPRPTVDATAKRKPVDAAPTAEFVLGHPAAVGSGTRRPPAKTQPVGAGERVDATIAAAPPAKSDEPSP